MKAEREGEQALIRQRRQQEARERKTADELARQNAALAKQNARARQDALARQSAERPKPSKGKAKAQQENTRAKEQEANGRNTPKRQEAERVGTDVRDGQKHSEKLLSLLTTNARPDPHASRKHLETLRSEQATCTTCHPPAPDNQETPQSEQTAGPESQPPVAAEQTEQTPDDPVPSRLSSDAPPPRVLQPARFLIPSDSSPRLPAQRSNSFGPDESGLDDSVEARLDLDAETQRIFALRQQRLEFGPDDPSSAPTLPRRRFSATEREEPSEITIPAHWQPDVQRETSVVGANEQRPSDVQQQPRDDAVQLHERPRVVFLLGSETSEEAETDTTTEQQLALNEAVAQRESAGPSTQQQHRGDAVQPRERPRVVFQLGSETSEADINTTAEQQLALNEAVAQRESTQSDVHQQHPDSATTPHRAPRVVFQLGSETSEADTDTTAEQQMALNEAVALTESAAPEQHLLNAQQQHLVNGVPPHSPRRAEFQLGSETSEADTDTTAERQLASNREADLREANRRIALNFGEIDVPTDSFGDSSMTSDAHLSPVRQAPHAQTALNGTIESVPRSGVPRITVVPVSNTRRGLQPHRSDQIPRSDPQQSAQHMHPARHDPRDYQQHSWNPNPAAGQFFPDPNAASFYPPSYGHRRQCASPGHPSPGLPTPYFNPDRYAPPRMPMQPRMPAATHAYAATHAHAATNAHAAFDVYAATNAYAAAHA